jgi:malate dehydrogenase (oxaloacetate-decarboxylating)
VVASVHPTILVGTSTQGGAFTEAIVRDMAAHTQRPMIFPMSNPTELIEAVPSDVIHWTDGRGLVGTGTPWATVPYNGVDYEIGQANNALIFPGIGLGTIVSRASRVTDRMLLAAAHALASLVDASRPGAGVLPSIEHLRSTSATVAAGVARQAIAEGVAQLDLPDPERAVRDAMWTAALTPLDLD